MLWISSAVSGNGGSRWRSLESNVRGALRSVSGSERVVSATASRGRGAPPAAASAACSWLNHGSPKPTNGRRLAPPGGNARSAASDPTEGSTTTACVRASQGTWR